MLEEKRAKTVQSVLAKEEHIPVVDPKGIYR
jgi:hypothetical protein